MDSALCLYIVVLLGPIAFSCAPATSVDAPAPSASCGSLCNLDSLPQTASCAAPDDLRGCFTNLIVFGDSLEDTGNLATIFPPFSPPSPYGMTWPGCPMGRYSDGRLFSDFYAESFGIPHTKPWQACKCGTNFATAGATALNASFYQSRNISITFPVSIFDELQWYAEYRRTCSPVANAHTLYCIDGGGNDYTAAALAGYEPQQIIRSLVDLVVSTFIQHIQVLLDSGARNILIQNIPQTSCTPLWKTALAANDVVVNGCLAKYGKVIEVHNRKLLQALFSLRVPTGVSVAVEDRYAQFYEVWNNAAKYDIVDRERECCGGGGPYNFNPGALCGSSGSTVCSNPLQAIFWDQVHFTDHFDRIAVRQFLSGKYLTPVHGRFPVCR